MSLSQSKFVSPFSIQSTTLWERGETDEEFEARLVEFTRLNKLRAPVDKFEFDSSSNVLCSVCGATERRGVAFHYGAYSCVDCKIFYKKTVEQRTVHFPCQRSWDCPIDTRNKQTGCKACWLCRYVQGMLR